MICFIGSRCNNHFEQNDEREGLEIEGLEGEGLEIEGLEGGRDRRGRVEDGGCEGIILSFLL